MNSVQPKVSILTTCHNRAHFIGECIESVKKSRFQDYEHIIMDDASTDSSVDIAKRYAAQDSRIKVFVNSSNLGDYANRNQAAQYATGKYLKYLDSDDKHGRWILDIMVDAMEEFPEAELGLLTNMPADIFPILYKKEQAVDRYFSNETEMLDRSPLGAIIKRERFLDIGGFSGKRMVGDFELWLTMALKYPVVEIPHKLARWRVHDVQEMSTHSTSPIWGFRYLIVQRENLQNPWSIVSDTKRIEHLHKVQRTMSRAIILTLKKADFGTANEMRKEAHLTWKTVYQHL